MSRFIDANIPRKELCDWLHRNYVSTEGGQWDDGVGEYRYGHVKAWERKVEKVKAELRAIENV